MLTYACEVQGPCEINGFRPKIESKQGEISRRSIHVEMQPLIQTNKIRFDQGVADAFVLLDRSEMTRLLVTRRPNSADPEMPAGSDRQRGS